MPNEQLGTDRPPGNYTLAPAAPGLPALQTPTPCETTIHRYAAARRSRTTRVVLDGALTPQARLAYTALLANAVART